MSSGSDMNNGHCKIVKNAAKISTENLEKIMDNEDGRLVVDLKVYSRARHGHDMCAAVLRKVRKDKEELEDFMESQSLGDHGVRIAINSMKFMLKGIEMSIENIQEYKKSISGNKNARPRVRYLKDTRAIPKSVKNSPGSTYLRS